MAKLPSPFGDTMVLNASVGAFTRRKTCRFCEQKHLEKILDFGNVPLAGGFLRPEQFAQEKVYPLDLNFCHDCSLVQVSNVVEAKEMFKNYFYFSSAIQTLVTHCADFAREIVERFSARSVFEIGCNDGVMLRPLAALGARAVGMDPATNVVNSIKDTNFTVINDFFNESASAKVLEEHGSFDAVVSSYSFAHIDDMISVIKGVKKILKPTGVFVFEVYYLGTLMDEIQYDMIYHEHLSYYSLKAIESFLARFGMMIFDIKFTPGVRSGAVRFYACCQGTGGQQVTEAVILMRQREKEKGYADPKTFIEFGQRVRQSKADLLALLKSLKQEGRSIIGYGASGRGTIVMNYCGIDGKYLDYVVDDAPAKQGYYMPGLHVPIRPWAATEDRSADYVLLFAWSFIDEVKQKRADYLRAGGRFIVPLPQVKVIGP